MADSKKLGFSTSPKAEQFLPKFHGLVLGLVGLIDAKGINVTQPIWLSGCPTKYHFSAKNTTSSSSIFVVYLCTWLDVILLNGGAHK